jgi:hypothetical protein
VFAKRTRTKKLGRGRVGYTVVIKRASKLRRYRVVVLPRTPSYAKTISRGVKVPALPRRHRH